MSAAAVHIESRADVVLAMLALAVAIVFGAMTYASQARVDSSGSLGNVPAAPLAPIPSR